MPTDETRTRFEWVGPTTLPAILLSNVASFTVDKSGTMVCSTLGYRLATALLHEPPLNVLLA
jgi:hypothetical protein